MRHRRFESNDVEHSLEAATAAHQRTKQLAFFQLLTTIWDFCYNFLRSLFDFVEYFYRCQKRDHTPFEAVLFDYISVLD